MASYAIGCCGVFLGTCFALSIVFVSHVNITIAVGYFCRSRRGHAESRVASPWIRLPMSETT